MPVAKSKKKVAELLRKKEVLMRALQETEEEAERLKQAARRMVKKA